MKNKNDLIAVYRDGLLHDTLPFWINNGIDREHGGFLLCLDRDGTVIDTDKYVWIQARFTWLLATMYNTVEPRAEWLELAKHGIDFIRKHAFDKDGRMFFRLTRTGEPLVKRRYLFSESFAVIALAAYARAAKDEVAVQQALDIFKMMLKYHTTPGLLPPKMITDTRQQKGLAMIMILITTARSLSEVTDDPICQETINKCIRELESDFLNHEHKCVMETVGPNGEFLDHFDGRLLNPGHAIEAGWFVLHEARIGKGDTEALTKLGCKIIDWSWELGWDKKYGGLFYFRDAKGLPSSEYWHDMKFWWPHNEAIIATLLAYKLTGDEKYCKWHGTVHDWAYSHFPDHEHGEWFGYLHRDGSLSSRLKGNQWKGPFHLPRMQWYCWKLLENFGDARD